ncbi:heterokaryon incompatibility protein-domain-containing protein, partial [Ganoderma leucocontextum]
MRLLDAVTGQFVEVTDSGAVEYAIFSHTWDPKGEQSYQELRRIQDAYRPESEKVRRACAVARAHGHRLLWLDMCCIDRTSSAELSEAVNSMFRWYRDASVCYVFLSDEGTEDPRDANSAFRHSRWFRRGWTLQELIAPRVVVFLSLDWRFLGTKASLAKVIKAVTGIDRRILLHRMRLDEVSVAKRMSWAAERKTTRVEDEAYSLLGIFDVNMPILYGEGQRAFVRLQEEIVKHIPDQSLFTW